MESLLAYRSQYGAVEAGSQLFPDEKEIRERLAATARFYGNLVGGEVWRSIRREGNHALSTILFRFLYNLFDPMLSNSKLIGFVANQQSGPGA